MHAYITDSGERREVPLYLAGIAIVLSVALSALFNSFQIPIPGWLDITSMALLYGLIYWLFDEYWWRWQIPRQLRIVRVPVLAGRWTGLVKSSYDDHRLEHPVELLIEQTWTGMQIRLTGKFSRSHSFVGAILVDAPEGIVLDYEYQNEPLPHAVDTMQIHHGTARLTLQSPTQMEGYYYTGRGRENHGFIRLSRSS